MFFFFYKRTDWLSVYPTRWRSLLLLTARNLLPHPHVPDDPKSMWSVWSSGLLTD